MKGTIADVVASYRTNSNPLIAQHASQVFLTVADEWVAKPGFSRELDEEIQDDGDHAFYHEVLIRIVEALPA